VWQPGAERVIALAPHMDDETIGCGGARACSASAGAHVRVVFLTDGRYGSSKLSALKGAERHAAEDELAALRKKEAHAALEILGVKLVSYLDAEDGHLLDDKQAAGRLRTILEEDRPELVYLPSQLEQHPDHYAASRVLLDATQGTALDFQCCSYEVWTPLFPNCLVKIDEVVEVKRHALQQYRSQLEDQDYVHSGLALSAYRSAGFTGHYGRYAEAFCVMPLAEHRALFAAYRPSL
jgi:LmbE family N-acetylglucosaminyl deacetylase